MQSLSIIDQPTLYEGMNKEKLHRKTWWIELTVYLNDLKTAGK